jgi:hypothetical protein
MKPALALSYGFPDGAMAKLASHPDAMGRIVTHDLYDLPALHLNNFSSLLVSMHVDQRFLASRVEQVASFLQDGGTVVANGHLAYPFLPGITGFHALENYGLKDLSVRRLLDHAIWAGVSESDLTFRRGVAGFYGRAWHEPPDGATVVHALGTPDRPLDFIYRVGRGRVLFHGGNDLWQYGGGADSAGRILPQLLHWMFSGESAT